MLYLLQTGVVEPASPQHVKYFSNTNMIRFCFAGIFSISAKCMQNLSHFYVYKGQSLSKIQGRGTRVMTQILYLLSQDLC